MFKLSRVACVASAFVLAVVSTQHDSVHAQGQPPPDHPAVTVRGKTYTPRSILSRNMGSEQDQTEQFPPHKVVGNLYYVGTKTLTSFLIVTTQGNILVNSTYERNVPVIRKSVEQLGFKFSDIKVLLGTHAHGDHQEGDAEVKRLTGAQVAVMAEDVPAINAIKPGGKEHPVDRVLHDGDSVTLGDTTLVAHLTPGHTRGATTWTMRAQEGGRSYDVVISTSLRAPDRLTPPVIAEFKKSFPLVRSLPCDVLVGDHAGQYDMQAKYARLRPGGPNPFVDKPTCTEEIDISEAIVNAMLREQGTPQAALSGGSTCAALSSLTMPDVSVVSATSVAAGPLVPTPGAQPLAVPAICRIVAVATPTPDSHINFEVWIPSGDAWNGKFQGVGTGGFAGSISYGALAEGVRRGYAAASTDTGHIGDDLTFAQGHPERIIDWGYRSIHVMTDAAKLMVRNHTGRFPDRAYFNGCATGGHQAMMEVQRFPADYDGVVAGNPAADRTNEIVAYLWDWRATHSTDGKNLVAPAKFQLLTRSAVATCDGNDGVKDGVIDDPRQCRFDPASLLCKGEASASCLTPLELEAVRAVYAGPRNPRTGEQIFPGWPLGSEGYGPGPGDGWRNFLDVAEPRRVGFFRYFVFNNPAWDFWSMDWDRDVAFTTRTMGFLNATAHDLSPFRDRGGKIVMHTGWVDPILPATDVIKYYDEVTGAMGGRTQTETFFRFFLAPGMGHCSGGPGPNVVDGLTALEAWVEKGTAPDQIIATRRGAEGAAEGTVARTRPLCLYPKVARWSGRGSVDAAENFACVNPDL